MVRSGSDSVLGRGIRVTIEEFIEARIAEDERIARAAAGAAWVAEADIPRSILVSSVAKAENKQMFGRLGYVGSAEHEEYRQHIVRHDPARVLRQCAALRRIVDAEVENLAAFDGEFGCGHSATNIRIGRCREGSGVLEESGVLRALAAIWSDHVDYQQDWAK